MAYLDVIERNLLFPARADDAVRHLGREIEQGSQRARSLGAGSQFQHLAKQHQYGDGGRHFEIELRFIFRAAEAWRKNSRSHRSQQAVSISSRNPNRDQAEHVEAAGHERFPSAL